MDNNSFVQNSAYDKSGNGGRYANWLPPTKVPAFKVLFDRIAGNVGGYKKAREFIGLGGQVVQDLKIGRLSEFNGRKILDAYNKIKGKL